MPMDFSKLKPRDKTEYLYRCRKCGEEAWFVIKLPPRMEKCRPIVGYCGGILDLVDTKKEKE